MFLTSCSPRIFKEHAAAMTQVIVHAPRDADLAALDQALEPGSHVHAVAEDVALLDHDVADIDADPEAHASPFGLAFVRPFEAPLGSRPRSERVEQAGEFGEHAIAGCVRDPRSDLDAGR